MTQCELCGAPARSRFCSRACSSASRKSGGEKPCCGCGAAMRRRDGEHSSNWKKRKTCSWECALIAIGNANREFSPAEQAEKARARARKYRSVEENRLRANETTRAWQLDNPARVRKNKRRYYEANMAEVRRKAKEWERAHPEYQAIKSARRRAVKSGAVGRHTAKEWLEKCELLGNVCIYCGEAKPLTQDHKVPLSRGGSNYIENLVPACRSCNSSKGTRTSQEFLSLHARIAA